MSMNLPRDNKSSCELEVTLVPGQSLTRGSSLPWVHVNRPSVRTIGAIKRQFFFRMVTHVFDNRNLSQDRILQSTPGEL